MAEAAGRCRVGAHSASGTKQRPGGWMFYTHLGDRPSQRDVEKKPLAARQIRAADVSVAGAHRRPGRTRLRGPARVPMMETADQGCLDEPTPVGTLHRSRLRGVLVEGQVSPGPGIVGEIGVQDATQLGVVQHHHVVEALAAQGPDQTFDREILPRRPRGDRHLLDAPRLGSAGEGDAVDRIAVTEEVWRRRVPWERLDKLLGGPLGRGGVGDVDVDDAAAVVREDQDDEQHLEQHGGPGEDVHGDKRPHVVGEKRPPSLSCVGLRPATPSFCSSP